VTAVGSLSRGDDRNRPIRAAACCAPPGRRHDRKDEFVRGKISSWNISAQKALGKGHATVAYGRIVKTACCATATSTVRSAAARRPAVPARHRSAMNIFTADGKVYDRCS
jgi:hypothetical protein